MFYKEIASYYDFIFPINQNIVKFIQDITGKPPKEILDIACGTGTYSLELAKLNYHLTSVDIDTDMINELKTKAKIEGLSINIIETNMLSLKSNLIMKYDTIFCIGNSLAHLNSKEEILLFLKDVHNLMKPGGSLLIQIVNYDRIIEKAIDRLPTIKNDNENLTFERLYNYDKENNKIIFSSNLIVNNNIISNSINLIPILYEDLYNIFKKIGFYNIKVYGDFKNSEYDKHESYSLIISAKKL